MSARLGSYIREARRKQKLTLRDLAAKTGIDYSMLSKYENGILTPPPGKLNIIASVLNLNHLNYEDDGSGGDLYASEAAYNTYPVTRERSERSFTGLDDDQLIVSDSDANREVLKSANGRCELCGKTFPDGEIFLEAHHVVWLRDGGTPTVENTVALCPNCHKRVHLYRDPEDTKKLLQAAKRHK